MNKVLIIGLDGATLDLIEPWVAQGELPNLARLMAQGSYGRLRSVLPVLSSSAWASFMTGLNPGKHGIFDFVRRESDGYRLRLVNREQMRGHSLWHLISHRGHRVGVLNVPMTYPPETVNGWLVTGLGTPDFRPFTYPDELATELLNRGYQVNKQQYYQPGKEAAFLKEVYHTTDQLTETALRLLRERPWEFAMVVYRDTDELAHFFWRHMDPSHPDHNPETDLPYTDAILDYYRRVDTHIGRLLALVGSEVNTILVSDHGGGPLHRDVLLNEWLRQKGYLLTTHEDARLHGRRRTLARLGLTRSGASTALRSLGLRRLEGWIKDRLGDKIEILPRSGRAEFPTAIDWRQTQAYSFGYHGQIYINLKGREPQGIISPGEEYDRICARITAELYELTDPQDGKPVVDEVVRGDAAYHGPCMTYAPDLIVVMREMAYITRQGYEFGEQAGEIFTAPRTFESGSHRFHGVLIMAGPDIKRLGAVEGGADLIDLAPTVLHLMNCPVPAEMDGQVLESWLAFSRPILVDDGSYPDEPPRESGKGLTDDEEAAMLERLRHLGYLE